MSLPRTKKFISMSCAGKVMLRLFWVFIGPIGKDCWGCGQTVNSAWYYAMLEEELKPAIYSKCRGMPTSGVVFHHNNT